jgi:uncharacterized protein (TIGR00251 family)
LDEAGPVPAYVCVATQSGEGDSNGVTLALRVQPRASRIGPVGVHGERLKWAVQSAPVEGQANIALIASLASFFGVARSAVSLRSGQKSKNKLVFISGVTIEAVRELLEAALP